MKKFFLCLSVAATFLTSTVQAAPGSVVLKFTAKKLEWGYTQRKNGDLGEYTEDRVQQTFEWEKDGSGSLAAMKNSKHSSDWHHVVGKDIPGRSEAKLVVDGGELYWETEVEVQDKDGKSQITHSDFDVEFTKGDWNAFEKGEPVEFRQTKAMKRLFVKSVYAAGIKLAKQMRDQIMLDNPCAKVSKVKVINRSVVGDFAYKGDAKAIDIVAPVVSIEAQVDIN